MKTKKLVLAALLAALTFISTVFFKIPSPLEGYINLGDAIIILSAFILPPHYAFLAAGIGSALADILGGFVIYAPATFLIKGGMVLIIYYSYQYLKEHCNQYLAQVLSATLAEIFMIAGYYIFESFLYGFNVAWVNIPINGVQGLAGIVIGVLLYSVVKKRKLINTR